MADSTQYPAEESHGQEAPGYWSMGSKEPDTQEADRARIHTHLGGSLSSFHISFSHLKKTHSKPRSYIILNTKFKLKSKFLFLS